MQFNAETRVPIGSVVVTYYVELKVLYPQVTDLIGEQALEWARSHLRAGRMYGGVLHRRLWDSQFARGEQGHDD